MCSTEERVHNRHVKQHDYPFLRNATNRKLIAHITYYKVQHVSLRFSARTCCHLEQRNHSLKTWIRSIHSNLCARNGSNGIHRYVGSSRSIFLLDLDESAHIAKVVHLWRPCWETSQLPTETLLNTNTAVQFNLPDRNTEQNLETTSTPNSSQLSR